MAALLRIINKLPLPTGLRLAWDRLLLERAYARDIATAQNSSDSTRVEELESNRRFELERHDEEEDSHLTHRLLARARRLRLPIPHVYNPDNTVSEYWREGRHSGRWLLTTQGVAALRDEIRRELKARHELRAHWVVWLAALTGLIGAITGLVAVLAHFSA